MPQEGGTAQQGTQGAPQPSAPDWNMMVPVKVNGVEQMLTLREAVNGYATQASMHEARTRANAVEAELARYKDVFDQMEADPAAFVDRIRDTYNLNVEQPQGSEGDINPLAAEMAKLRADMERLAGQAVTQQEISTQERQLSALSGEEGFDRDKLLAYATAKGVNNLEHAWLMYQGEHGQPQAAPAPATPHQAALDAIVNKKAQSLGMVNPGATAAPAGQSEVTTGPPSSTAEALLGALGKHDMTMDGLMSSMNSGA